VFWPVLEGLMALRGVNLLTATTEVAEIGDLQRFASAPQLNTFRGRRLGASLLDIAAMLAGVRWAAPTCFG
jgi:Transposase IS116/IS110/IS902 family